MSFSFNLFIVKCFTYTFYELLQWSVSSCILYSHYSSNWQKMQTVSTQNCAHQTILSEKSTVHWISRSGKGKKVGTSWKCLNSWRCVMPDWVFYLMATHGSSCSLHILQPKMGPHEHFVREGTFLKTVENWIWYTSDNIQSTKLVKALTK